MREPWLKCVVDRSWCSFDVFSAMLTVETNDLHSRDNTSFSTLRKVRSVTSNSRPMMAVSRPSSCWIGL